jgi:hypothetical protein
VYRVISFENGEHNIDGWPHICEPALLPETIGPKETWTIDLRPRAIHLWKFWFVRNGAVTPGSVLQCSTANRYFRDTVVIAFLDGGGARADGVEAEYNP